MLDQGAPSVGRHFSRKFSCAFRLRKLAPKSAARVLLAFGLRHFTREFSCKMALVTCPCAFRLCKLAHNVSLSLGVCLLPENSRIKLLV